MALPAQPVATQQHSNIAYASNKDVKMMLGTTWMCVYVYMYADIHIFRERMARAGRVLAFHAATLFSSSITNPAITLE